jgi:hypothetical protein
MQVDSEVALVEELGEGFVASLLGTVPVGSAEE